MTKFVRVTLENGAKASVNEAVAETAGLKALDEPATDHYGRPLPVEQPEAEAPQDASGRRRRRSEDSDEPSENTNTGS